MAGAAQYGPQPEPQAGLYEVTYCSLESLQCTASHRSGLCSERVRPCFASSSSRTACTRRFQTGSRMEPSSFQPQVLYRGKSALRSNPTSVLSVDAAEQASPEASANARMSTTSTLFIRCSRGILSLDALGGSLRRSR